MEDDLGDRPLALRNLLPGLEVDSLHEAVEIGVGELDALRFGLVIDAGGEAGHLARRQLGHGRRGRGRGRRRGRRWRLLAGAGGKRQRRCDQDRG
jgi:hypothetical protein